MKNLENSVILVKTIKLRQKTFDRLKEHGKFDDSIDDVINRLIDEKERKG